MFPTATDVPLRDSVWRHTDSELARALAELEAVVRRAQAEMSVVIAELERRSSVSQSRARQILRDDLRLSNRAIRHRLRCARATQPQHVLGRGDDTTLLPATRNAFQDAEITGEHVEELARVFEHCPDRVTTEDRAELEETLLNVARTSPPEAVRRQGEGLLALWDRDGEPPSDDELSAPSRELHCYRSRRNGSLRFNGLLDKETGDQLEGLLGALATPSTTQDGVADTRSRTERDGDALAQIVDAAARADDSTVQGGESAVIVVTATLEDLQSTAQQALLGVPGCTNLESLRRSACDARLVPAIFRADGEPLHLGRGQRLTNTAQRRALAVRDQGCAFPGCARPPKWTQPHHVTEWAWGGPTDLDNLVLLCAAHHRVIHHSEWQVRINRSDKLPEFIPPGHVDTRRRPLRNHAHGPPRERYQRFCRQRHRPAPAPSP